MRALLLAAGLGTRLRPVTDSIPKCLVPIKGKPLMGYWLEMLNNSGVRPVLVNTHYFADKVKAYIFESQFKRDIHIEFEEELQGTGGTLLKNKSFFQNEPFMVIHGDNLCRFRMDDFLNAHKERPANCLMTMMLFRALNPESCGIVELSDNGVVRAFHEKVSNPPGNLANGAVYIFEPAIFPLLESLGKEKIDLSTEVIPGLLGQIFSYFNDDFHMDIGSLQSLELANRIF